MKEWQIRVHFSGAIVVTVRAETQEEAEDRASDKALHHIYQDGWKTSGTELEYKPIDVVEEER